MNNQKKPSYSGTWQFHETAPRGEGDVTQITLKLTRDGNKLTGNYHHLSYNGYAPDEAPRYERSGTVTGEIVGDYAVVKISGAVIWLEQSGISQFYIKPVYRSDYYSGEMKPQLLVTALEEKIKKNDCFREWDFRPGKK